MQTDTHNRNQLDAVRNEQVLTRQLLAPQQTMMALGGAIGTGPVSRQRAGGERGRTGHHPVLCHRRRSFRCCSAGADGDGGGTSHGRRRSVFTPACTVSPFAGYAVRVSYWLMEVVATGGQLVAASIYMAYWFPQVPGAVWVLAFAVALVYVNSRAVGQLGLIESWLVLIKVVAVAMFVGVAVVLIVGRSRTAGAAADRASATSPAHGGFMPFGVTGVWLGCCFVDLLVHRRRNCGRHVGRSGRSLPDDSGGDAAAWSSGLSAIYIVTITLLVALTPWNQLGVGESPFVSVLRRVRHSRRGGADELRRAERRALELECEPVSHRAHAVLARARRVRSREPRRRDRARARRCQRALVSSVGLGAAVLVRALWPDSAYVWFFGVALFGGLFVWLMIFVTHIAFRGRSIPVASCAGATIMIGDSGVDAVCAGTAVHAYRRRTVAARTRDRLPPLVVHCGTTAVTSISTFAPSSINALTSTALMAAW